MPTISTSIRLPQELYEWLKSKAEKEHRTISNALIAILTDAKDADAKMKKCKYHCDYGDGENCHYTGESGCMFNK